MTTTGSVLVTALEQAWQVIQVRHPDVPDVLIIVGSGRWGRSSHQVLSHYWHGRWATSTGTNNIPELFVGGELLVEGGAAILETLLHEAAHGLAAVRSIKDCSRSGNRYHNRQFADHAAELGLTPPDTPTDAHGYSDCTLAPETASRYQVIIGDLNTAITTYLGHRETGSPYERSGKRFAIACACNRRIQVSPRSYEDGPIICGNCRKRFVRVIGGEV